MEQPRRERERCQGRTAELIALLVQHADQIERQETGRLEINWGPNDIRFDLTTTTRVKAATVEHRRTS